MQKLLKLSKLLLVPLLILSGCNVVNIHKFSSLYIDSFTFRETIQYAKYMEVTPEAIDNELNKEIYTTLLSRVTTYDVNFSEEDINTLNQTINEFRKQEVKIILINADEKSMSAKVKVYISNAYDLLTKELRENVTTDKSSEQYNSEVIKSLNNTIKNAKNEDTIEVTIEIEIDPITRKYYISSQSQKTIIEFVLGLN